MRTARSTTQGWSSTRRGHRSFVSLLGFVLMVAGCQPQPPAVAPAPESDLLRFSAAVQVRRSSTTDAIEQLRGDALETPIEQDAGFRAARSSGDYASITLAFLNSFRHEFRLQSPLDELAVAGVNADNLGFHQVRLNQRYSGLRVLDAELIVHFDSAGRIYLVQGHYLPTPVEITTSPALTEQEARRLLAEELGGAFAVDSGELVLTLPNVGSAARVAYRYEARQGLTNRREVLVDAETGATLRNTPLVLNAH